MSQLPLFVPETEWRPPAELPDLRRYDLIAIDTETRDDGLANDIGPGWAFGMGYVDGISYSTHDQRGYIPLRGEGAFPKDNVARWLRDIYRSSNIVYFNAPYDIAWLDADLGVGTPDNFEDAMLGVYHLDENRLTYNLDDCCQSYGIEGKDVSLLREAAAAYGIVTDKKGRPKKSITDREIKANMWKLPSRYKGPYAEADARATLQLWEAVAPLLREEGQFYAYSVDRDLIPMTIAMRLRGVGINYDACTQAQQELLATSEQLLRTMGQQLGLRRSLDISEIRSWQSLQRYFDEQNVPYPSTDGGQPSFTAEWMSGHEHWLPAGVAQIRQSHDAAEKFIGNYLLGYSHKDRIHAEVLSYRNDDGGTRSHRFSYRNPPLQQMPARVPLIKKLIRGAFVPDQGADWLAADYSQQEPRLTVHYAARTKSLGWEAAIDYYTHGDGDYHTMVATMTGLPRGQAKIINLGLAYGMGKALLAASLGVSIEEAESILRQYHSAVPFIQSLTGRCTTKAGRTGKIVLIDGAISHFDLWEEAGWGKRGSMYPRDKALQVFKGKRIKRAGTHKAMNRLIQGSAARQTKKAMLDAWKAGFLPYIQMHDELDFPVTSPKEVEAIGQIMRDAIPLMVPVKVDLEVGKTWGAANTNYKEYYDVQQQTVA